MCVLAPYYFLCEKLVVCKTVPSNCLYCRCAQNAFKCISCWVITGQMFQNHWDHLWVIRLPTLPWLYATVWLNTVSSLLSELVISIDSPSSHTTSQHSWKRRGFFALPNSLILSSVLSSQIIHSRAKSQSLSQSYSVCLYGSPTSLLPSPFLSSPPSLSLSWGGEKFMILWGTEWHRTSQSAYQCA